MKLIVLALVFQFVISCWPKTNIVTYLHIVQNYTTITSLPNTSNLHFINYTANQ